MVSLSDIATNADNNGTLLLLSLALAVLSFIPRITRSYMPSRKEFEDKCRLAKDVLFERMAQRLNQIFQTFGHDFAPLRGDSEGNPDLIFQFSKEAMHVNRGFSLIVLSEVIGKICYAFIVYSVILAIIFLILALLDYGTAYVPYLLGISLAMQIASLTGILICNTRIKVD